MARRASPTDRAIQPNNQPEEQLSIPSRHKPGDPDGKPNGRTRKSSHSSTEEIRRLKAQLAQREAEISRLANENQLLIKVNDQHATELQIINNIGQTLTDGLDLQSTLERVGERLREALQLKSMGIIANDSQTGLAITYYLYHYGKRVFPEDFSPNKNRLAMRFALKMGGKPLVVNTNSEKYWRRIVGDMLEWPEIPRSFVIVPLLAGRQLVGSITIGDYEEENAFINLPINLLETIASNLGTAIQNVRLFEETQRLLNETEQRATELQIINNIGQTLTESGDLESMIQRVGERIQEALNVNNIAISIFDEETEHVIAPYMVRNGEKIALTEENFDLHRYKTMIRASARRGGVSWVVKEMDMEKVWRKSWRGPIADDVPKSMVVLPLLAGGEVIGGISLADYEDDNAFTELSVNLLETIASNMGTAIQNVRLFDETQRLLKETEQRATELQIINNIGQTLTEGGDLNSMIQRVGERIQETLRVKDIIISVFDEKTGRVLAPYMVRNGKHVTITEENFDLKTYKFMLRASARAGGRSWVWVVNTNAEKGWRRSFILNDDVPKSFVTLPLLAGRQVIGGITIADFESENAFSDISVGLLETIASNMGTAVQNVRLFDETRRLFKEAEEARASAERANKAKSTFLANMSHELRTPLNAIIGFTRIVKRKAEGALPEKQIDNLDKVLVSSEHLLGLINTVLDIAKIEAGRMDVLPARFSMNALADQCAMLAMPLLKPNVTLEKQVDETVGFIFSDQDKIKQIVLNLLSNAAKFTNEGRIILAVDKVGMYTGIQGNSSTETPVYLSPCVRVSVIDSGIGISEEALGRVFEEFQQADNTTTREYGGTGLGLTISRNLARLLGGDLTAASELGKGSTFTLTFPVRYEKKPASALDASTGLRTGLQTDSVDKAESDESIDSSAEANESREPAKTILIVEDTDLNVQLLTQLLENDYKLLVAKDGLQGVSMAQQENPDLILMDVSLPLIDGYEATRRIRTTLTSTPIIGLSAHAMSGDAEKAKQAGCNDYLTKPVDEALLIQKLNQYLR